jgi:ferredoxin
VKNNYGLLTGAQKAWYHYYSVSPEVFAGILVEMYRLRKPDLVIMDAILAMEGYGPASPETRWVNKVLASTDGVAMDTVQTQLVGFQFDDVPYLRLCREMGLGETDTRRIEILGDASPIADYHRPTPPEASYSYRAGVGSGRASIDFYRDRVAYRPAIRADACRYGEGCRDCIRICPSGALTEGSGVPTLEPSTCFICSACKEVCPHAGLELVPHPSVLASLRAYEQECR